ncbi:hypothetical protein M0R45_027304 [Rubus argutus]|uniref:Uncharacterized protein n=1 Tax=Rubus argutus TaxID=59490 RepID=A0AAW1X1T3_RUBAR
MASKFNKVTNKDICLQALLGLFVGAIFSSCFHGFHPNVEELNRSHFTQSLVELQGSVAKSMQHGLMTLVIKFLHFFISRCLQFRYSSLLESPSYAASMLFWVALTRSVSSMSDSSL